MSDSTRAMGRPLQAWPSSARAAAAVIAVAVLALLAACSVSGSPSAGGSGSSPSAVAFSACMRSNGVPNYPDPDSSGQLPKTDAGQLGVSTSQYEAAQRACRHLLPTGGSLQEREVHCIENSDCPPALMQQTVTADRGLAQCIRSHGMPNFPDPTTDSIGRPFFPITAAGISEDATRTHQFIATMDECARQVQVGGNYPPPESFG